MLAVVALAAAALTIATPGPIEAAPHMDGASANFDVRGRAPKFATVQVRTRCALGPCIETVGANKDGRWSVPMNLVLDRGQRSVKLRVTDGVDTFSKRIGLTYPAYAAVPPYSDDTPAPQLAVIGDSLSVGADIPLRALLPAWKVTTDGRVGRELATGMDILARTPLPARPVALAFSLFSNDDPTHVAELDAAVRTSISLLGRHDCAIWATIVRPKLDGVSYQAANDALTDLAAECADSMILVPWAAAVKRHPEWLSDDKVHPTTAGYAQRARLFARAAEECRAYQGW